METVAGLLGVAGILIFAGTVLGLVSPSIFRNRKTGEPPKRSRLLFKGIGASLFFLIVAGVVQKPESPKPSQVSMSTDDAAQGRAAPTSVAATGQPESVQPSRPPAADQSTEFTTEEQRRYCTSFGLLFTSALKARYDQASFDGVYKSATDAARFVVTDGNATKLTHIEQLLTNMVRDVEANPPDASAAQDIATRGFDAVMKDNIAYCNSRS